MTKTVPLLTPPELNDAVAKLSRIDQELDRRAAAKLHRASLRK